MMNDLANDLSVLCNSSRQFLASEQQMLINGEWVSAQSSRTLSVYDPSSGAGVARVPEAGVEDVDKAVRAAKAAFEDSHWAKLKPVASSLSDLT